MRMRGIIDINKITKEQIDKIFYKNILNVVEDISIELTEQIINNVEHVNEQDKNVKQFSVYLLSTTVAVQVAIGMMENTLCELLCDKES